MNKYLTLIIAILAIGSAFLLLYSRNQPQVTTSFNSAQKASITIGTTTIYADIANTSEERERGLGGRPFIKDNEGMLFVFDNPDFYTFWMKDMVFPIDIIWLDKEFRVVDVTENVLPSSFPEAFKPSYKALYVLEVQSGFFEAQSLEEGSLLKVKMETSEEGKI